MRKKVNLGKIENNCYIKYVDFSKAVLWKDRSLSVPPKVIVAVTTREIPTMVFIDHKKMEKWIFHTSDVIANMTLKKVGQEEQYYFSIDLASKVPLQIT